ncbi:MAG: hypothetical protein WCI36_02640 [bacterium]
MKNKRNKNGYVMMYSVIILGSMISAMAIYITWVGVFSLQNTVLQKNSKIAQDLADTCAESALMVIWNNMNASGTTTRSNLFGGSCFYQINVLTGENREIFATGVVGGVTRKTKVLIDQVNLKVNVFSWREVADF